MRFFRDRGESETKISETRRSRGRQLFAAHIRLIDVMAIQYGFHEAGYDLGKYLASLAGIGFS